MATNKKKQKQEQQKEYPFYDCIRIHKDDIQIKAKENYGIDIPDEIADAMAFEVSRRYELDWDFWTAIDNEIEEYIEEQKEGEEE